MADFNDLLNEIQAQGLDVDETSIMIARYWQLPDPDKDAFVTDYQTSHNLYQPNPAASDYADFELAIELIKTFNNLNEIKAFSPRSTEFQDALQSYWGTPVADRPARANLILGQQVDKLLEANHITSGGANDTFYRTLMDGLTDFPAKQNFIEEYANHHPSHSPVHRYSGAMEGMLRFVEASANDYSRGTPPAAVTFNSRSLAETKNLVFVDPYHLTQFSAPADRQFELGKELNKSPSKTLLTGIASVNTGGPADDSLEMLLETIKSSSRNFDSVIIPLAISEPGYSEAHNILLELRGDSEARIIDPLGDTAFDRSKKDIAQLLENTFGTGMAVKRNPKPLSADPDRGDCAVVCALVTDKILNNSSDQLMASGRPFTFADDLIDRKHTEMQDATQAAMLQVCTDNPLFKLYLRAKHNINDINSITDNNHLRQIIEDFSLCGLSTGGTEFHIGESIPLDSSVAWKEEVNNAVIPLARAYGRFYNRTDAANEGTVKYQYKETSIVFTRSDHAQIESSNLADYIVLCNYAKTQKKDTITFGTFENHPEQAAILYLACLQTGMKMRNAPPVEQLKKFPQYNEIKHLIREQHKKQLRTEMRTARASLLEALENVNALPEYQDFKTAETAYENNPLTVTLKTKNNELALKEAALAVERNPARRAILQGEIANLQADIGVIEADPTYTTLKNDKDNKENLYNVTPEAEAYNQAEKSYNRIMQAGMNFALGDPSSPEYQQRLNRIKGISARDLNDPAASLTKRKDAQGHEIESDADFALRQQAVRNQEWHNTIRQRPGEPDADFLARQADVQSGDYADALTQRPDETAAEYTQRQDQYREDLTHGPRSRSNNPNIQEKRKITQQILTRSLNGR